MSAEAESGFELFKGKAGCVQCHGGLRFTDDQPHNIGVPDNPAIWNDPLRHSTYVAFGLFMGIEIIMNLRRDVGAHVRSHKADGSDIGKFMTPGLRDLKLTGPYMHNGTFDTLGPPPIPADNPQTPAKVELGKLLFFDPRLGDDGTVSCASCHLPSAGWGFPDDLSMGYPGTVHWRNSQTIMNTAYYGKLF